MLHTSCFHSIEVHHGILNLLHVQENIIVLHVLKYNHMGIKLVFQPISREYIQEYAQDA